ncbi:MAG TPA: glycogen synthase GlgA, partial [Verrucomicrobiota bacterium]|nr:glycogen synthase GlgA [Verrucomicrobiota bacterium]
LDAPLDLPLGDARVKGGLWHLQPEPRFTVCFVDQPGFYLRSSLYHENGADYPDNAERFLFFSKAVVHVARHSKQPFDVLHVHDWQTGFVPLFVHHERTRAGWGTAPRTCMTIHNLAYQGVFPAGRYVLTNLPPDYFTADGVEFHGQMSCLKAGITYADILTTVSPRYAREITTPELGCGLDALLRRRNSSLVGILNGVDYDEWNTDRNPHLARPYSVDDLSGKAVNKQKLQRELGLPETPDVPLFGSVSRLVEQKGVDIQLSALEEMLSTNLQFVLLGSGQASFEEAYRALARRYPTKVAVRIGYDAGLAHRIEAGCDFFLMPSRFEPCGLNQMYSLRYGTVPIVRATGGLDDTVIDVTEDADRANGIKFLQYTSRALARSIRKALALYGDKELLVHYRSNAMLADFSWERTTARYIEVYRRLTGRMN